MKIEQEAEHINNQTGAGQRFPVGRSGGYQEIII